MQSDFPHVLGGRRVKVGNLRRGQYVVIEYGGTLSRRGSLQRKRITSIRPDTPAFGRKYVRVRMEGQNYPWFLCTATPITVVDANSKLRRTR